MEGPLWLKEESEAGPGEKGGWKRRTQELSHTTTTGTDGPPGRSRQPGCPGRRELQD